MLVGLAAMVVGYIGGFTYIPWFMVYDFPWVTARAIIPCFLAMFSRLRDSESGEQSSEAPAKSLDIRPQQNHPRRSQSIPSQKQYDNPSSKILDVFSECPM